MTRRSRPFAAAITFLAIAIARPGSAQPRTPTAEELETARVLYKEGKELRARGDLRGALEKLQAAHALGNTPVTGIELARTYGALGLTVEARETCLSIARIPVASDETAKSAEARTDAASLAEDLRLRIPTLAVRVEGLAPGETARLWIGDVRVPDAAVDEPRKVDPGRHEVVVRAGEGLTAREVRGAVEVQESETQRLTLTLPAIPPSVPSPSKPNAERALPPEPRPTSPFVTIGFVTVGLGVGVGSVAGIAAINWDRQLRGECPNKRCDPAHAGDLHTALDWANGSTASFCLAGIGAIVGIVAVLTSRTPARRPAGGHSEVWITPGGAGLYGTF